MPDGTARGHSPRAIWGTLFAFIALALVAWGSLYYRMEAEDIRREKREDLAAIGKLKVDQIMQWRAERLAEAWNHVESPFFRRALEQWVRNPDAPGAREDWRVRLQSERDAYGYSDVLLFDVTGRQLLALKEEHADPIDPATQQSIAAALAGDKAVLSDLYRCPSGVDHIDAVAPVRNAGGTPFALLVLRSDADTFLYPLIQSWPAPSLSAETLLVKREGNDVVFLNTLRHRATTALTFRNSLSNTQMPAVQAVLGKQGIFEGIDYRGVPVLADMRAVPDSPWFMVAKVDTKEILSEARYRAGAIAVLVAALVLLSGASIAFIYRQRQARLYRDLYRFERERREAQEKYRATLYSIGDAVITTDELGRVMQMNPVAERLTGWLEAEAQSKPLDEVFRVINEATRETPENPAQRVLREGQVVGLANHLLLIDRDGVERPIADSGAPIRDCNGVVRGIVLVFRDQSEERAMEKALQEGEASTRAKLNAILSPEGDLSELNLADAIDVPAIQAIMDDFYHITAIDIAVAIVDLEGKVLVATGWQDICTKFHRVHPETCKHCTESDLELATDVLPGTFKLYKCKNNLWDMTTPIILGDKQLGSLFLGQFFFEGESPSLEVFRAQARQYGFDEDAYLAALDRVPRCSRETVNKVMSYYARFANMIAELSFGNLKLARAMNAREHAEVELRETLHMSNDIVQAIPSGLFIYQYEPDDNLFLISANPEAERLTGIRAEAWKGREFEDIWPAMRHRGLKDAYLKALRTGESYETEDLTYRDELLYSAFRIRAFALRGDRLAVALENVTEKRRAEQELRELSLKLETAVSAGHVGLWEWDIQTNNVFYSAEWKKQLGYQDHEISDSFAEWKTRIHPDDLEPTLAHIHDNFRKHSSFYQCEFRMRHKDDTYRWILAQVSIVRDETGNPIRCHGSHVDITESKLAEETVRESEANFRAFFETITDMIAVATPDGRVMFTNALFRSKLGYTEEELAGMYLSDVHPPDFRHEAEEVFASVLRGEREVCPLPMATKSGALLPVETRGWFGRWNGVDCIFGVSKDLSAEREAQQRFERLFRQNPALLALSSLPDRIFFDVNDSFLDVLGYQREEVIGKTAQEMNLFPNQARQTAVAELLEATGRIGDCELDVRCKDGRTIQGLFSGDIISIHGKQYFLTLMVDITERKHAEEALRESQERFKAIADYTVDLEAWFGPDGRLLWVNPGVERISGFTVPEVLAMESPIHSLVVKEDLARFAAKFEAALYGGSGTDFEFRAKRKDGSECWLSASWQPIFDAKGCSLGTRVSCRDISDRKRAEEALQQSESELKAIYENAPTMMCLLDTSLRVLYANRAFVDFVGDSEAQVKLQRACGVIGCLRALDDPLGCGHGPRCATCPVRLAILDAIETGKSHRGIEYRTDIKRDGAPREYVFLASVASIPSIRKTSILLCLDDITERKQAETHREKLEAQLRQSQKMEAVGQLAGGVAHDFNNLLQVILGNVDLMKGDPSPGASGRNSLIEVRKAATRAADLTRQLLAFSRQQVMQPVVMDMNDLIEGVLKMVRRLIGEHINLVFMPGACITTVHADKGQIEQVLMNLCVNARDAMPSGGTLTIETEDAIAADSGTVGDASTPGGRYVLLSVTDTGHGMDEATRAQIFEPFFTTKEVGQGTGLGLATVYGIVKQHNGHISVHSELGRGSSFRVYLPAVGRATEALDSPAECEVEGGTETILVAEDEENVRRLVRRMLRSAGYTVLLASDGEDAVRVFDENAGSIDLVLMDVIMPKLGGRQAMELIKSRNSTTRFLFSSGYSADALHKDFRILDGLRLIKKPYSQEELLRAVREVIDSEKG